MSMDRYASNIEQQITRRIISRALEAGYAVSVYDGGEMTVRNARDAATIWDALCSTSDDVLTFRTWDGARALAVCISFGAMMTI